MSAHPHRIRLVFNVMAGGGVIQRLACYFDGPDPVSQRTLDDFMAAMALLPQPLADGAEDEASLNARAEATRAAWIAVFDAECRAVAMLSGEPGSETEIDVPLANVTKRLKVAIALEVTSSITLRLNGLG